jgi:uncharacterized repeat protein (TIGR03803 family)
MANRGQHRGGISSIRLRTARAPLALVVVLVLGVVTIQSVQAQTFKVLFNFTGSADGESPYGSLVRDTAGNLYGTTEAGGASGAGTVFKVNKSGTHTVLYSFKGGSDGANPYVGVIRDAAGNLYGTTANGGASGLGTVFKLTKTGNEKVLYSFAGGSDGCYPYGGLLRDAAGNLYGTTEVCGASGVGTVFKLTNTGKETVLHSFAGGSSDGEFPSFTSLLMDTSGNLYGVAEQGGTDNLGVVYKLSKSGKLKVLHSFAGGTSDGCDVFGTPVMDAEGNLYGTANACGSAHVGIVWKVSQKGKETVLHTFTAGSSDGAEPIAGVIMDANGNLYGDTYQGGSANLGTVYKLNKTGKVTLLHTFTGPDGDYPYSGVIRDSAGNLYGTTIHGGSGQQCQNGCGTVWKLKP